MAQLLTVEQVAEQLQISIKSIYNMRSAAPATELPQAIKVGKYLRWRQEDVDAWIAGRIAPANVTQISTRRAS